MLSDALAPVESRLGPTNALVVSGTDRIFQHDAYPEITAVWVFVQGLVVGGHSSL